MKLFIKNSDHRVRINMLGNLFVIFNHESPYFELSFVVKILLNSIAFVSYN